MPKKVRTEIGGYYSNMNSKDYWTQRSKESLSESFKNADAVNAYYENIYKSNYKKLLKEYKKLMNPYVLEDGSIDISKLGKDAVYNAGFMMKKAHLEQLVLQMSKDIAEAQEKRLMNHLIASYAANTNRILASVGISPSGVSLLHKEAIIQAVKTPFTKDGREFSDAVWDNLNKMQKAIRGELTASIAQGKSIDKTARKMRDLFGVSLSSAERIVRTETLACYAKSSIASYQYAGIEELEVIAESDACEDCAEIDGNIIRVDEAQVGINIPPVHPNCRCCVAPIVK